MIFEILNEANNAGLKVILLTGKAGNTTTTFHDLYGDYLGRLAKKLKNNTTLMAYDLYNEPANMSLSKEIICNSVNNWYTIIKTNDPNHMVTIGLQNALDVFSWDPGLLSVDFLSFHLYPFPSTNDTHLIFDPRKRVFSDIKWISNIANKITPLDSTLRASSSITLIPPTPVLP